MDAFRSGTEECVSLMLLLEPIPDVLATTLTFLNRTDRPVTFFTSFLGAADEDEDDEFDIFLASVCRYTQQYWSGQDGAGKFVSLRVVVRQSRLRDACPATAGAVVFIIGIISSGAKASYV